MTYIDTSQYLLAPSGWRFVLEKAKGIASWLPLSMFVSCHMFVPHVREAEGSKRQLTGQGHTGRSFPGLSLHLCNSRVWPRHRDHQSQ